MEQVNTPSREENAPVSKQVKEVVEAVVEALRVPPQQEPTPSAAANSFEAENLRAEMIRVGRKLWQRQYVDGNGGNISVRLGAKFVLCTPTMLSKGDLEPADICLSDLDGNILAGDRLRTSEFQLHLEIYRANPRAKAVVHCHPPYGTAFAITGSAPPVGYVSEYEFFVGPAAVAPYETPGTKAFAETVIPFVQNHNTILLSNHGVVCWADTVTHAEWLVEVLDTYCKTILIAEQTGRPLKKIAEEKLQELLLMKRRMGLPDERLAGLPELVANAPAKPNPDLDMLVKTVLAKLDATKLG